MPNPAQLPPGFRFHPTDEELILHYLRNRSTSIPCPVDIIAEVDIYKFDPWELPDKATHGDKEWYFFTPRDRKYPNGIRPNRAAGSGYWKATGTDKPIQNSTSNENIGVKKALVFYKGRPPKGVKTNWIMHEYRLAEAQTSNNYRPLKFRNTSMRLDDWVLCRIYKKSNQLSAVPPLVDHEQDYSSFEENPMNYQSVARIPKTCSISDFLVDSTMAQLFDMPDMSGSDKNSLLGNQNLNQMLMSNNSNMVMPVGQIGSSFLMGENSLKRERIGDGYFDEGDEISRLNPNKRQNRTCIDTDFSNQVNALQRTLMGQPVYGQQLLNSTLGMP